MKNSSTINWNKISKTLLVLVLFSFSFLLSSDVKANDSIKTAIAEIKYLGSVEGNPVFQISFENQEGEDVYLALRDENGNTIYADFVKGKNYTRKIQFDGVDLSELKLTLSLRSKNGTKKQNFQINKSTQVLENIEVANL